ncbi:MAG: SDR family oxidoreductase [Fidelibacterota bacterium]
MFFKKILVTGCHGLLGQKVIYELIPDYEVLGTGLQKNSFIKEDSFKYAKMDITDRDEVLRVVRSFSPDVIINTASFTEVDRCEIEKDRCWKVNVGGIEHLLSASRKIGSKIIHISSDYVFDGTKGPYTEADRPNPINYYGKSKLASENILRGENRNYSIIRTIVLYGMGVLKRLNFAVWVIDSLKRGKQIKVVNDQFSNPTLADNLAECIRRVIQLDAEGLFHFGGADLVDRCTFALRIAEYFNLNSDLIEPVGTSSLNQIAKRPLKSGLVEAKARDQLGLKILGIDTGLERMKVQRMSRSGTH